MIEVPEGYHVCESRHAVMTICEPINGQITECLSLCENISREGLAYFWLALLGVILVMLAWGMWKGRSK